MTEQTMTVRGATTQWLADRGARRELNQLTIDGYGRYLKDFAEAVGPERDIRSITPTDFRDWLANSRQRRTGEPYAVTTLRTRAAAVRIFFADLAADGVTPQDPTLTVRLPKPGKRLPRAVNDSEVDRLLAVADHRTRTLVLVMLHTGLRRFEVAKLRIEHWERDAARLRVVQGKGNKDAVLPVSDELAAALQLWVRVLPGQPLLGPLFPSSHRPGLPIAKNTVNRLINKAAAAAGVDVTPHCFRHAYGTNLCADGVPMNAVRQLMRHENLNSTQVYVELAAGDLGQFVGRRSFLDERSG